MPKPTVVGMFRNPRVIKKIAAQRPSLPVVLSMNAAQKANVEAYFFGINDIDFATHRIYGYVRNRRGLWKKKEVPWPDVFYDRGVAHKPDERDAVREVRLLMSACAQPLNAVSRIGKHLFPEILEPHPIRHLVPDTRMLKGREDIDVMLERHGAVMVKPVYGRLGRSISVVTRVGVDMYSWHNASTGDKQDNVDYQSLMALIRGVVGERQVLVQQKVELMQLDGSPFDIRVLMCKDGRGRWRTTQNHIWVFKPTKQGIIVREECDAMILKSTLPMLAGKDSASGLYASIIEASHRIVGAIENHVGPMGEIGLDYALDTSLRIWFFEANAMPEKDPQPCDPPANIPLQFILPMEYCKKLAQSRA